MRRRNEPWSWTTRQYLNHMIGTAAYEDGQGVAGHWPHELYLQVASGCNIDCYMCYEHNRPPAARRGRGVASMSPELFRKLADEVFPYSRRVAFGLGGEPTLSEHFPEFVESAWELDQHVHVTTNGTRITTDATAELFSRCLRSMDVSIDAATPETYERIRFGSKWRQLRANFDRLNRFRSRAPADQRLELTLCFVMMRSNISELPAFVELAAEVGAERVHAHHVIPVNAEGAADRLDGPEDAERTRASTAAALDAGRRLAVDVDVPRVELGSPAEARPAGGGAAAPTSDPPTHDAGPPRRSAEVRCHMPSLTAFVLYDGRVHPCCHPYVQVGEPLGDLNAQSFAEIWNGRAYRNLRRGLRTCPPEVCRSCSIVGGEPVDGWTESRGPADLVTAFGDRDLAPLPEGGAPNLVEQLVANGAGRRVQDMARHIDNLERLERDMEGHIGNLERVVSKTRAMGIYRALGAIRSIGKRPTPP